MQTVSVSQISTSKEMRAFVRFNYELYKDCPYAVPDLLEDTLETFDARRNPAFRFCQAAFFLARREGRITVPKVEKFWWSFLDTVRTFGRTYEIGTMVLYMLRSLRVTTDVDLAPGALAKGKLGFQPHTLPNGAEAISRIFTRYKERAQREGVQP